MDDESSDGIIRIPQHKRMIYPGIEVPEKRHPSFDHYMQDQRVRGIVSEKLNKFKTEFVTSMITQIRLEIQQETSKVHDDLMNKINTMNNIIKDQQDRINILEGNRLVRYEVPDHNYNEGEEENIFNDLPHEETSISRLTHDEDSFREEDLDLSFDQIMDDVGRIPEPDKLETRSSTPF
jgi:hypothetical protein